MTQIVLEPDPIPIIAETRLYLERGWRGDGRRFARLFSDTWKKIPRRARRRMLKHWETPSDASMFWSSREFPNRPRIELTLQRVTFDADDNEDYPSGFCTGEGHNLWFSCDRVDAMPDAAVQDLIAHELAHVAQHADGGFSAEEWERYKSNGIEHDMIEQDAIYRAGVWGFDHSALEEWEKAQPLSVEKQEQIESFRRKVAGIISAKHALTTRDTPDTATFD